MVELLRYTFSLPLSFFVLIGALIAGRHGVDIKELDIISITTVAHAWNIKSYHHAYTPLSHQETSTMFVLSADMLELRTWRWRSMDSKDFIKLS